jgi:hypothetical protein
MHTVLDKFEDLKGQILVDIEAEPEWYTMSFTLVNGDKYELYHEQGCCEEVRIEDIAGDLNDLIGLPILLAEEVSNINDPPSNKLHNEGCYTWTFYKLATNKGYVTVRWFGTSNGYYSERVSWHKIN